tara:strand:- start:46 stop:678 length:633 start_codon:yes stop_codon:yes gene_type:complete
MMNHPNEIHSLFLEIAADLSPQLADSIKRVGPIELQSENSIPLAEHMCRSVTGQQLSVKVAKIIWGRLLEASGDQPLSEFITIDKTDLLRSCGLSAAKVRTVCGIAEEARAGNLEAVDLGALNHQERSMRLIRLWGIGQWTVDMISIFYFGDEDVWPDGDLIARTTLEKLTSKRRKTVRTAERFAPYRSRLAIYMWEFNDLATNPNLPSS